MARAQSIDAFARDLFEAGIKATVAARPVVKKAAQTIKDESRANVLKSAPVHNAGAHNTITYDEPSIVGWQVRSEVGYDRDAGRAAALGNLLEYGGGGDRSPAHRDIGRAADNEEPRFAAELQQMATRLL